MIKLIRKDVDLMRRKSCTFLFALLLGFNFVSTTSANSKIKSLQSQLNKVESDASNFDLEINKLDKEVSDIRNSLADETSKINSRIEKFEK